MVKGKVKSKFITAFIDPKTGRRVKRGTPNARPVKVSRAKLSAAGVKGARKTNRILAKRRAIKKRRSVAGKKAAATRRANAVGSSLERQFTTKSGLLKRDYNLTSQALFDDNLLVENLTRIFERELIGNAFIIVHGIIMYEDSDGFDNATGTSLLQVKGKKDVKKIAEDLAGRLFLLTNLYNIVRIIDVVISVGFPKGTK